MEVENRHNCIPCKTCSSLELLPGRNRSEKPSPLGELQGPWVSLPRVNITCLSEGPMASVPASTPSLCSQLMVSWWETPRVGSSRLRQFINSTESQSNPSKLFDKNWYTGYKIYMEIQRTRITKQSWKEKGKLELHYLILRLILQVQWSRWNDVVVRIDTRKKNRDSKSGPTNMQPIFDKTIQKRSLQQMMPDNWNRASPANWK